MPKNIFPLKNPMPDFDSLLSVVKGEAKLQKLRFVEFWIDEGIMQNITESLFGKRWIPAPPEYAGRVIVSPPQTSSRAVLSCAGGASVSLEESQAYWKQSIDFYYRMGYDYIPDLSPMFRFQSTVKRDRIADDTSPLEVGKKRIWAEEGIGMIDSWESFEKFPWEKIRKIIFDKEEYYSFLSKNLPEGMKITPSNSLFEQILEWILGYEGLFVQIHENPDLVKAIFDRFGEIVLDFYNNIIDLEIVGVIWHADDMGYKTGTMISPEDLRKYVFPWHKKYSKIAHDHGKMFWFHSCGNLREIMGDLIEDVEIDAFQSFQDSIIPIQEFRKLYENKIATFGGIDVDKMCRLEENDLRKHVRTVIEDCMLEGKYALGTGNTVCNYMPVKNYLAMLEEGLEWKP